MIEVKKLLYLLNRGPCIENMLNGVDKVYMCNFWDFGQWPGFKFRKRVYVQLLEVPTAKFHVQIWQFWKTVRISETAAHGSKISSISAPTWCRQRVYVQLLELLAMAKFVLKQSSKAHGPLVIHYSSKGKRGWNTLNKKVQSAKRLWRLIKR